jgi:hypothetical protein
LPSPAQEYHRGDRAEGSRAPAALLALVEAYRLARRLAGGSRLAGLAAVLGVALCGGFAVSAGAGYSEPVLVGLALLAVGHALDGRLRHALAPAFAAALLRPEMWPFLALLGAVLARRRQLGVPVLVALMLSLLALWFVPDFFGAGDLLRSYERARVPNPGAPALQPQPALESLGRAASLGLAPLFAGVVVVALGPARTGGRRDEARAALHPAGLGLAWVGLVAAMSEGGFSGEERYLMPGVAVACGSAAVGVACAFDAVVEVGGRRGTRGRSSRSRLAICAGTWTRPRAGRWPDCLRRDARRRPARRDRAGRWSRAGAALRPSAHRPYRGPLLAWHLGVHKADVRCHPTVPAVIFRSRLTPAASPAPYAPAADPTPTTLARGGAWEVLETCP